MTARNLARFADAPASGGSGAANDHEPAQRSLLRFFTCGSVDDGKSTLIGRILFEAGAVLDDQYGALAAESRRFGTRGGEIDFSLLVDGLSAEREQGITIDVAYRYFATPRRAFIVADTPGHEQYTRNMATGASTADVAVILIDARLGLLAQTRRHACIVSLVGVRSVVLAVNKMDLVGYDRAVFERIVADFKAAVAGLGFGTVTAIPLSARDGDNVAAPSANMPWHRGPTLLACLETVEPPTRAREGGVLFPVQWVNRPNPDFRGYSGTLARGRIAVGDEVAALPSGRVSRVARIIAPSGDVARAAAGQALTLTLDDALDLSRGDALVAERHRPPLRRRLAARLLWTGESPLDRAGSYLLKLATTTASARIVALHHRIDVETLAAIDAENLATNDIGFATLELDRPVLALDFTESAELGGFILIDRVTHATVAFGFVGPSLQDPSAPMRRTWHERARGGAAAWLGPAGSKERALRIGQLAGHGATSLALGAAILLATGAAGLALGLAAADFLLRPLVVAGFRTGAARRWRQSRTRALAAAENAEGGGI